MPHPCRINMYDWGPASRASRLCGSSEAAEVFARVWLLAPRAPSLGRLLSAPCSFSHAFCSPPLASQPFSSPPCTPPWLFSFAVQTVKTLLSRRTFQSLRCPPAWRPYCQGSVFRESCDPMRGRATSNKRAPVVENSNPNSMAIERYGPPNGRTGSKAARTCHEGDHPG